MQPSDRADFAQLITDVLAYYRQDASRFVLDLWWSACHGVDMQQMKAALQKHCTDPERGQFAPKVADIAASLFGTATDRAALAWGKAIDAASRVGAYADVVFDDAAIHAVIEDMGGWPKFCRSETKDLSYLQHRFTESYRAYIGRGAFDYPRSLAGDRSPDDVYLRRGLPPPEPVVIGDIEKARRVYRLGASTGKTALSFRQALEAVESGPRLLPSNEKDAA